MIDSSDIESVVYPRIEEILEDLKHDPNFINSVLDGFEPGPNNNSLVVHSIQKAINAIEELNF